MPFSYEQVSGTLVNYYMHCPRQAWLFNSGLQVEYLSDTVGKGKWIDMNAFKRKREAEIAGERIKMDFVVENATPIEIHEVKASRIPRTDHKMQLAFYLKKLKEKNVEAIGVIHYPQINNIVKVTLREMESDLDRKIDEIVSRMNGPCPQRLELRLCRGCAYYEFCYSIEVD